MKILCGIMLSSPHQLADLPDLKNADFIELPADIREMSDAVLPKKWASRVLRVNCRAEAGTFSSLIGAGRGVLWDFYRMFDSLCRKYREFGAGEISVALEWESVFDYPEYASAIRNILHSCFGITEKNKLVPLLEFRIPGYVSSRCEDFLSFRNSLVYPVRTLIDLHPHEAGAMDILPDITGKMRYDCSRFRVNFDAAEGNYLPETLVEKIKKSIVPVGCEVPSVCFYPGMDVGHDALVLLDSVLK